MPTSFKDQDLLGRIQTLLSTTDPLLLLSGLLVVLVLLTLALFGRRFVLFGILIVSATLSGAMWQSLDTGSSLLRFLVLALLAANLVRLRSNPGLPLLLFLLYVVTGIGMIPFSEEFVWSVQIGGLLLLTTLAAIVMSDSLHSVADMRRLLHIFYAGALVWLALGIATLPQLLSDRGARYSGAVTSATFFVMTGGMLLPILVWSALSAEKKRWKIVYWASMSLVLALLVISGQRTGTFAGIIGTIPIIAARGRRAIMLMAGGATTMLVVAAVLSAFNPGQLEYIQKRFSSADTTGRTALWNSAFQECLASPIVGRGHGGDRALAKKIHHPAHSAYLSVWYNTGLIGLSFFVSAFVSALWISWQAFRRSANPEIRSIAILLFGVVLAQMAAGFFETTTSPSSFSTIVRVTTFAMIGQIAVIPQAVQSGLQWYLEPRTGRRYLYVPGYFMR